MESTAPSKPTLALPANGSRMGIFRKQTPTFEWSVVTDDSGVSYNLEIGTDADFAKVLISKTGLTTTSYALTEAEALDYGTYYWRVKAIDGAQNDSGWSTAHSFKSGFLPLWAFITIVALIVVLIGILVYFFAIRRRSYYD
jgi:ABC-type branched-subunit amino acid transport system permease subunit